MNRRILNRIMSLVLVLLMACSTVSGTGVTAFAETSDGNPPIESVDSAASPADSKAAAKVLTYAADEENITDAYLGIALTGGTAFEEGSTLSCHVMDDQERASYAESLQKELDNDKTRTRQVSMVKAFDLGVSVPDHPVQKTSGAPVTVRMYLQNTDALSDTALYVRDENQAWHEVPFEVHKSSDGRDGRDEAESKVAHDLPYIECSAGQLGTFAFAEVSETDISADESVAAQEPVHEEKTYAYDNADARASNTVNDVYWWYDDSNTTLHLSNKAETDAYQLAVTYRQPWSEHKGEITQVVLDTEIQPASTASWFDGCSSLTSLDLGNKFDTSNVTDMKYMFNYCDSLKELNLGSMFDTSNVTFMRGMFLGCSRLTSLDLGDKFDTSNVTNMMQMFDNCSSLTNLDLGNKFDTGSVTRMNGMFSGCNSLTSLGLGDKFDTSHVTDMNGMFGGCSSLTSLDLGNKFDTGSVKDMSSMFWSCNSLTSLDLGDKFNTSNVKDMHFMFTICSSLTSLDLGDKFDTGSVTNMNYMFNDCSSLTSLDLGNKFYTGNVTGMSCMFYGCNGLTSLNLGDKFDTSHVTDTSFMFFRCSGLKELNLGDKFDTSNVTVMSSMFSGCSSLTSLDLGDKFDTGSVMYMGSMFSGCSGLKELNLGDKFDTSSVIRMGSMFSGCSSLTSLDLGDKFDTSNLANVTDVVDMLKGCDALQKLVSQKSGRQDIELPRKMIEQDSPDGVVYSVMPSGSKILVPFTLSVAESITNTTIVMRKSMDKSFDNVPVFEFGVYREDGTLVDTVKNDRDGNIVIETKDYALGRYYVQEKAGTVANIIYDTSKYYFTVSEVQENVKGVHVTHGNKVTYYTHVEPSLLTGSNLQLSGFSGVTVTDSKGKTHTLRAYCSNLSKHIPYGTAKQVYINPMDAEINKARGTVYAGPQKNLSDAIRCILYFENENAQQRIWDLFNRGQVIDTSRVNEIPADFQFAIITPPSFDMQPLIVPLADIRVEGKEVMEEITTGIVKKRVVTLETPVSVFKNRTRSSRLATLTVSKKVAGSLGDKHKDFKFCLALDDDSITSLSCTKDDVTETVTRNADNQFEFTLSDGESAVFADLPVGTEYTVTEPDARAEGYEVTADGATGTIQENGSTVLFTNHRSMVVPTEVDTNMAVFGMILAAGCVLLIGYCLKHRKK